MVHLVKDTTINSSAAPKSNIELVIYMKSYNGFDLLVVVFFFVSHQLGGIGTKSQYLITPFKLIEG